MRVMTMQHALMNTIAGTFRALGIPGLSCRRLFATSNHLLHNGMATPVHKHKQKDMPQTQGKLLVIEGNIAAGKSTFSKRLGEYFNYVVHDEPAPKNPYLAKFYQDPKKYALKLQLWLFQQRFLMYVNGLKHIMETGQGVILDRSVYSDLVFTNVVYQDGSISENGYQYYLKVRENAMKNIHPPFALIHLFTPPEMCFERIVKRGRDYEQQIPLSYLEKLDKEHQDVFEKLSETGTCRVLTYNWSEFGRDPSEELIVVEPNETVQFYSGGFEKIVADIQDIDDTWKPTIPDELLECDSEQAILEKILVVNGYENISDEIPE